MQDGRERRVYQRSGGFHCNARVSRDVSHWFDVEICDLSGEGVRFRTDEQFESGENVWLDMKVTGFLTDLEFITKGVIRHKSENEYGTAFADLHADLKIHIDEAARNFGPKNILY